MARPPRLATFGLVVALGLPQLASGPASAAGRACSNGYAKRRELVHGRFLDERWELSFFRDRRGRPCLADDWSRYGSIFRFRVREHRPRLGILHLAATSPPGAGQTVYVIDGYVGERVAKLTFRIDGRSRAVRIARTPRWTRLPKDPFIHFVGDRRYGDDATGRLRAFAADGRLLATRVLRRRQFFAKGDID